MQYRYSGQRKESGTGWNKMPSLHSTQWPTIEYLVVAYFWNFPVSIVEPSLAWDDSNLGN